MATPAAPFSGPVRLVTTSDGLGVHPPHPNLSAGRRAGSTITLSARPGPSVCGRAMIFSAPCHADDQDLANGLLRARDPCHDHPSGGPRSSATPGEAYSSGSPRVIH